MLYTLLRPLLFRLPPEAAHHLTLTALRLWRRAGLSAGRTRDFPCRVMNLDFPNPVGLAAGLDKNGDYIDALGALGFGFIEVGTVTPRPQPGNPAPRLFRLPSAQALINRMGFNNRGVDYLVDNLKRASYRGVLGVNIGKNRDTPLERAAEDYLTGLRKVYPYAGYVTVNVSSPNTAELRRLQYGDRLERLLDALQEERIKLAVGHGRRVPLAVKIAPDLSEEEIASVVAAVRRHGIDAVIATNTTLGREGVESLPHGHETGGLSGRPLRDRATRVVVQLHRALGDAVPVIAVGGIMSGADAVEKFKAGARLVQIYTGLIYRGPDLVRESVDALRAFKA